MFVLSALTLPGCGGSSSDGGPSGPLVPTVTRTAVAPASADDLAVSGFDASGRPVWVAPDEGQTKWTVYANRDEPLYEVPLPGIVDTRPAQVLGKYALGDYEAADGSHGVLVVTKGSGAPTSVRYPGYVFIAADGGRAVVGGYENDHEFFLLDLAAGTFEREPLPEGTIPRSIRGGRLMCSDSRTPPGILLWDLEANAATPLRSPSGTDGSVVGDYLNKNGKVLGVTRQDGQSQLRIWDASGEPGEPLDTAEAGGFLNPGWLSPDGTRMAYGKSQGGSEAAYMRVGALTYPLRTDALPLSALYGLNDAGTAGFGYDAGQDSRITVKVAYR